ncbi:hypothetical protein IAT38_005607 [Cryptococcus sp. DSM 104549]
MPQVEEPVPTTYPSEVRFTVTALPFTYPATSEDSEPEPTFYRPSVTFEHTDIGPADGLHLGREVCEESNALVSREADGGRSFVQDMVSHVSTAMGYPVGTTYIQTDEGVSKRALADTVIKKAGEKEKEWGVNVAWLVES